MEAYVNASECYGKGSLCFYPSLSPLVSWYALIGGDLIYLALIFSLKAVMCSRKTLQLTNCMILYNTVQVVLSASMAIFLAPFLKNGVFNLNGQFCARIELGVFIHYCSKYLDMFDTVFMVLRKKDEQLSFLHVYHHTTIGFIWGLLLQNGIGNGTAYFGAWINSSIHFLMYFHYLWTSFGLRNPLKTLLTKCQMIQFGLCITHAVLAFFFDYQFTTPWLLLQISYHISLLILFRNFELKSRKRRAVRA